MHPRIARARGFGLLEAIVALVLLAGSAAALFSWINQNLAAASRLRQAQQEAGLSLAAQSLLEHLNPAREPAGQRVLGDLEVRWTSQVVHPLRDNAAFMIGQSGTWRLGLYRVAVQAQEPSSGARVELELIKLGMEAKAGAAARSDP